MTMHNYAAGSKYADKIKQMHSAETGGSQLYFVLAFLAKEKGLDDLADDVRITAKLNALVDPGIIRQLYKAADAGVEIDLIVRGICCLKPGVEGYTDNIRIISIVGRFLEHSRIYIFGTRERAKVYIASADYMTRNTLRRVEVAAPILDPALRGRVLDMFDLMLRDDTQARDLLPDGSYKRRRPGETPLSSQEYFYREAYAAAQQST